MVKTIAINYRELVDALSKMDEENPDRTYGELNLLMDNIKYHLSQFLRGDVLTVELDFANTVAYIDGKPIIEEVDTLPDPFCTGWWDTWAPTPVKMYRQIKDSLEESKLYGIYEKVFCEVRETDRKEDEQLTNADSKKKWFDVEMARVMGRKKITDTTKANLYFLGRKAGMSEETMRETISRLEAILIDEEDDYWNQCNTVTSYREYLRLYPQGKFTDEARKRIEIDCFNRCKTIQDYEAYLKEYPDGRCVSHARAIISKNKKMRSIFFNTSVNFNV